MNRFLLTYAAALCFFTSTVRSENWPAWRGPHGTGVSSETTLPTTFGPNENITWVVPLPGGSNSTPIVWGDAVFVTCPLGEDGKTRSLICFDRATGKNRWQYDVPYPHDEEHHSDNPFCSGSPTTDGRLVYASFGSAGIVACDFAGNVVWRRDLGPMAHVFGLATSPVLYKHLLLVHRGPGEPTHIVALNKRSGGTVWDTDEVGKNDKLYGSWSTPVIYRSGNHDEFALSMPGELKGYDALTGKELWRCEGLGPSNYPDTAVGDGVLVGISGFHKSMMGVRMGGRGDVTKTHRMWHVAESPQRVGSGVIRDGYLYVANAPGVAECFEVATGKSVWKTRLGGRLWGSMLLAGDHLYVANTQGVIFVLAARPEPSPIIAQNDLGEETKGALAASNGQLFIRTYSKLYCVGKRRDG